MNALIRAGDGTCKQVDVHSLATEYEYRKTGETTETAGWSMPAGPSDVWRKVDPQSGELVGPEILVPVGYNLTKWTIR